MVGRILVAEGINAGATYSVVQLVVKMGTSSGPVRRRGWLRTLVWPRART